uniref:Ribosomal RNA-processing protein 8 n=1 Tax=Romanomermis culicivorax TaxID=13658 RepID=A0A915IL12_ROMCU
KTQKIFKGVRTGKKKICQPLSSYGECSQLSLIDKMNEKLKGARFRFINETLYTKTGEESFKIFRDNPETFHVYHEGYEMQKKNWPVDPLDVIIAQLTKLPKFWIIADIGCGSARLSQSVPQVVHSFDLVAANENVTACDMADVPLEDESVDVAVYCLSLMGTNLRDYIVEANRILKPKGILKIAEIFSRLPSVRIFKRCLDKLGFAFTSKEPVGDDNYFILLTFEKASKPKNKMLPELVLKPCLYKKR